MGKPNPTGPVAGWKQIGGRLVADTAVAGCLARGVTSIKGHCRKDPCRRTVALDLELLVSKGFGTSELSDFQRIWRCALLTGCGLTWENGHYPHGVPLAAYLGEGNTVTVSCGGCGAAKTYEIDELIRMLTKCGVGDGNTSVLKVARAIRGPCKGCGARRWEANLNWPVAKGGGQVFTRHGR